MIDTQYRSQDFTGLPDTTVSENLESPFLLIVSREGREEFVKNELATRFLGAKFSFSRPGFLSFKQADAVSAGQKNWKWSSTENLVFPLRSALFVGKWTEEKGFALAPSITSDGLARAVGDLSRVHVHSLDFTPNGKENEFTRVLTREELEARYPGCLSLMPFMGEKCRWNENAAIGEVILQAIAVSDKEVWLSWTKLRESEFGFPGGESHIEAPAAAPSRAYLKFAEAATLVERRFGKPIFKADDRAIEIGAAPGGACFGLLERGLRVTGVDRGRMDPIITQNTKYSHVESSIGDWMFPEEVNAEWLLIDMNAEARIAVRECKPLTDYIKRGLKGIFFTLKLNQVDYALATERLARMTAQDLGVSMVFIHQLPSNHQEIALFGLTKKGMGLKTIRD